MTVAEHNRVQLIWLPGHKGIVGSEVAVLLAKQGSEIPFIGHEPACRISVVAIRRALMDRRVEGTLLKSVTELVTGYCHLKG
jgi:hypothetical protein